MQDLEIYYTIENIIEDTELEIDNTISLYDFFSNKFSKTYNLVKCKRYYSNKYYDKIENNVVKKGLCVLDEMHKYVKYKTSPNIWFIYISSGNIIHNSRNQKADVLLINKNINIRKCDYIINNTSNFDMFKYLDELFITKNYLKYDKIFD
jgi:hypothetical protein